MFSPEYAFAPDLSFDHALFRWCLRTLLHISGSLLPGAATAAERERWRAALEGLSPPQVDPKTGSLMIGAGEPAQCSSGPLAVLSCSAEHCWGGAGLPFAHANKHFSHLFSIFPLGELDWHNNTDRSAPMILAGIRLLPASDCCWHLIVAPRLLHSSKSASTSAGI